MPNVKSTKTLQKRTNQALDAFHNYYENVWGADRWHSSLFPALSSPTRYCALINQYVNPSEAKAVLRKSENEDREILELKVPSIPTSIPDGEVNSALALVRNSPVPFHSPTPVVSDAPETCLLSHWNMDAASVLAASVLKVEPGHRVLDICAAPGGKSIVLAQLLWPELHANKPLLDGDVEINRAQSILHANEFDKGRHARLESNLKAYLPRKLFADNLVKVLRVDGSSKSTAADLPLGEGGYDRVLLDAPCSSERHVIHAHLKATSSGQVAEEMFNWKASHSRILARTQVALLMTALRAVKIGGSVVYATCSVSKEENDEIVDRVLDSLTRERKKAVGQALDWKAKVDASPETDFQFRELLDSMTQRTKYGRIALPDHPAGGKWGPLYFCVLKKTTSRGKAEFQDAPEA